MTQVQKYSTSAGRTIYRYPVTVFDQFIAYIHVISDGNHIFLVDSGSGTKTSNKEFLAGFEAIREQHGETIVWEDIDAILMTHAHIDHFGGLPFARGLTNAPIGIHQLDLRVISHYEERRTVASRRLEIYLEQAGLPAERIEQMMAMYLFSKDRYRSMPTQFVLREGEPFHGIEIFHVPGHCPGQVCLLVDDVLLTADHILSYTTPHQAPESITHNMGLGHYLDSLDKIGRVSDVRLGLGGHEEPIDDVYGRIGEIKALHEKRLDKVLESCKEPKTIAEISMDLFGTRQGYHVLLAIEEAGAHAEYLYQRGGLIAANVDEIAQTTHPVIKYQRV